MVNTRKFSQFPPGVLQEGVGLTNSANTRGPSGGGGGTGGVVVIINAPTAGLAVGNWVRIDAPDSYVLAIASSAQGAEVAGVVLEIISPAQFKLQQSGYIPSGTPGFGGFAANGGVYFLSDVVAGSQMFSNVITNGNISKPVFEADSADSGWVICLSRGAVIGSPGPIPAGGGGGGGDETSIQEISQPGNTFQIGDWIRVSTVGAGPVSYTLASGNNLANAQSVGVVIEAGDPLFKVQFSGYNENTVTAAIDAVGGPLAIVSSTVYYLSALAGQEGKITPTAPTQPGHASKPVFISESQVMISGWVLPQRPLDSSLNAGNPVLKTITQAAHGFTYIGQIVKPKTTVNGEYENANAATLPGAFGVGMVQSIPNINTFVLQEVGYVSGLDVPPAPAVPGGTANPSAPFTVLAGKIGTPFYLSAANAGQMTLVEPVSPAFSKPIFIADQVGSGWILPMKPTVGAGGGGGGGKVAQFLSFHTTAPVNIAYNRSARFLVPFLTTNITPTTLTSKIRLTYNLMVGIQYFSMMIIFRNGIQIPSHHAELLTSVSWNTTTSGMPHLQCYNIMVVDEPNTLGPVEYEVKIYEATGGIGTVTAFFQLGTAAGHFSTSSWTVEEFTQ